jgi:exo-beta-1,3-glucanase (GH17 family)
LKNNLTDGKIKSLEQFESDLQLIWDNCRTYNKVGTQVRALGEKMEKLAKNHLLVMITMVNESNEQKKPSKNKCQSN